MIERAYSDSSSAHVHFIPHVAQGNIGNQLCVSSKYQSCFHCSFELFMNYLCFHWPKYIFLHFLEECLEEYLKECNCMLLDRIDKK